MNVLMQALIWADWQVYANSQYLLIIIWLMILFTQLTGIRNGVLGAIGNITLCVVAWLLLMLVCFGVGIG